MLGYGREKGLFRALHLIISGRLWLDGQWGYRSHAQGILWHVWVETWELSSIMVSLDWGPLPCQQVKEHNAPHWFSWMFLSSSSSFLSFKAETNVPLYLFNSSCFYCQYKIEGEEEEKNQQIRVFFWTSSLWLSFDLVKYSKVPKDSFEQRKDEEAFFWDPIHLSIPVNNRDSNHLFQSCSLGSHDLAIQTID